MELASCKCHVFSFDRDTYRLTMAQALVRFMRTQCTARDGVVRSLFAGCFGIFGHGNVGGMAQALHQDQRHFRYILGRNEQAMVHAAAGYARMSNRMSAFACATSIGPGASNLVTGAAGATINRIPVLLLPSDMPASRTPRPVLQQVELPWTSTISVNDALRPVSRYWDRIERPEQLLWSSLEAMRVLTDQAETGAVTLSLPTDVQSEAFDYPAEFFEPRVWNIRRPPPDADSLAAAVRLIRGSQRPMIVAGGGVIYSEATKALADLVEATAIPVVETHAGKGSLPFDHPRCIGPLGVNGLPSAFELARSADLVIGIGTRWTDVTSVSQTAFADPGVRFVNINIASFDAHKFSGLPVVADARVTLEQLLEGLKGFRVAQDHQQTAASLKSHWDAEMDRYRNEHGAERPTQAEVVAAVNDAAEPEDVVVAAAGSLPNDLQKLWRSRDPKSYHVEYGYSCMGYEIPGGLGVKMASPDREVFVMVGDGSYMMMPSEIVTAVQEGVKLIVVLIQNHGFASVGALSRRLGTEGFGAEYRSRGEDGLLTGERLPIDLAANAASLGATAVKTSNIEELRNALADARSASATTVIEIETDTSVALPRYHWWDVAIAEVSESDLVRTARATYEEERAESRRHLSVVDGGSSDSSADR